MTARDLARPPYAVERDAAEAAKPPILLVHKGQQPLTAGDIVRLAENIRGLGIPDDAPAEIRTPIAGDRRCVDIAFRRTTTTEGNNAP